jgi:polyisoprenoid-binding protein YceI
MKRPARFFRALAVALLALLVPPLAQAQQKLLPAQSEISFVSRQMGSPVEGRFRSLDAQITLDPKQLAAAKIVLVVDLASATLASTDTETELRQPDWFDVKKFPQATFTSSAVKLAGPGRIEVVGTFTLKGRSRPLSVLVTLTQAGSTTTAITHSIYTCSLASGLGKTKSSYDRRNMRSEN